mmetsp:Transcript_50909/g.132421  ORF Transcript_50909/g.132421 Transcript_50909/m.132421 type:complete len:254 (+) Transcript_50909:89-850(+)
MFYKTTRLAQPGTHTTSRKRPCSSNHNARQRIHADLCGSASSSSRWLPSGPQQGGHSLFDSLHDKIPRRLEGLERIVSMRHHARLVPQHDAPANAQHESAAPLHLAVDDDLRGNRIGKLLGECLLYLHHGGSEVWPDGELQYHGLLHRGAVEHGAIGPGMLELPLLAARLAAGPVLRPRVDPRHLVSLGGSAFLGTSQVSRATAQQILPLHEPRVHPPDELVRVDLTRAVLVDDVEQLVGLPVRKAGLGEEPR